MEKYIGMDAHSSICVFSVVDKNGTEVHQAKIATNGQLLVEYIRSIQGAKKLVFEECELSAWLCETLRGEVDELIVCNPTRNMQYKRAKTDKLDAQNLARLLRGGYLSPVYHDGSKTEHLRALMSGYQDVVDTGVSVKNRYKSLFRKAGLPARGTKLYDDNSLLENLPRPDQQFVGRSLYRLLETIEKEREQYVVAIKKCGRTFPEIKLLKTIPGIGDIQAAKVLSQVISAQRFKDKHKFWSYCGLVRHRMESGGHIYGSRRGRGNRVLKCVFKMAAKSVLTGETELRVYYDELRAKGTSDKSARNAVSRKLAAISLSVLKTKRPYDETRILPQTEQAR
ncbi:MAG: IS110 family transposase [Elusimicrobiota bacterium]